ncbi:hypothetical protein FKM82_017470 [Ascaphus truei]
MFVQYIYIQNNAPTTPPTNTLPLHPHCHPKLTNPQSYCRLSPTLISHNTLNNYQPSPIHCLQTLTNTLPTAPFPQHCTLTTHPTTPLPNPLKPKTDQSTSSDPFPYTAPPPSPQHPQQLFCPFNARKGLVLWLLYS